MTDIGNSIYVPACLCQNLMSTLTEDEQEKPKIRRVAFCCGWLMNHKNGTFEMAWDRTDVDKKPRIRLSEPPFTHVGSCELLVEAGYLKSVRERWNIPNIALKSAVFEEVEDDEDENGGRCAALLGISEAASPLFTPHPKVVQTVQRRGKTFQTTTRESDEVLLVVQRKIITYDEDEEGQFLAIKDSLLTHHHEVNRNVH